MYVNPSMTANVKISQNVDIHVLAKVQVVHLKVKHCLTLHVVHTIHLQVKMSRPFLSGKSSVWYC